MTEKPKKKWHFKTYKCFLCGKAGFKVHNRYLQDFIARKAGPNEKSQGFCMFCETNFVLYENPNPPGRLFMKRKGEKGSNVR